jgi:hypothetical protein
VQEQIFRAVTLMVAIVFALAILEAGLRLAGREPWSSAHRDTTEPTMHEPHAVLGWKGAEGNYVVPPYAPGGSAFRFSLDANGSRRTSAEDKVSGNEVLTVGGSFTQGWAIGDEESFAWKLQERFPSFNFINYGTGGYGTYQSLLVLERELPRLKSPRLVIYSYTHHHQFRNVAPASWLRGLARFSRRGMVEVPYVTLGPDDSLVRNPPEGYSSWPLRTYSSTITSIEEIYMARKTAGRLDQNRQVTEQLLLEMVEITRQHGADLLVVVLQAPRPVMRHYFRFLSPHSVPFADCTRVPLTHVVGEGHPDGKTHTLWTNCISSAVRDNGLLRAE